MKRNKNYLYTLSVLAALCVTIDSIADDTEIYFDLTQATDPDAYKPNVLFILDTSGSMTGQITSVNLPPTAYDPSTIYGSSNSNYVYVYDTAWTYDDRVIRSKVSCKAMLDYFDDTANAGNPTYATLTASYSSSFNDWSAFGWWSDSTEDFLECKDDEGTHGQTDATNPYTSVVSSSFVTNSTGNYYSNVPSAGPYSNTNSATVDWDKMQKRTFVTANYHDYLQSGSVVVTDSKTNIMKAAAVDLVNNISGLNLGLMRFNGGSGGYAVHHFSDVENDRANIISSINALGASGVTPLAETMWEAHRYYAGLSPDYGTGIGDSNAVSGGHYNTPIGGSTSSDCQANYVVYLTDGQPVSDNGKDTQISALGQGTCTHTGGTTPNSSCLDEMSAYMSSYDYNSSLDGDQSLKVFTIGFDTDLSLLSATATDGEDGYFIANNNIELREAFTQITSEILQSSTTFVAPSVSVNAFNSLQNRNEVYYALFEPNKFPRWYGNLKKYKINSKGAILGVGMDENTEKSGDVIGDDTGYFLDTAESYWGGKDGSNVKFGGAASKLTNTRTVYTIAGDATVDNLDLATEDNTVSSDLSKAAISNALYGIDETSFSTLGEINDARQELTNWILGLDVDDTDADNDLTDPNNFMSDPLHSRPIVVTYGGDFSSQTLDDTIFSMSNSGAFQAIDTDNGTELFSFIPPQLLKNNKVYFDNNPSDDRVYGLDGPLTIWRQESNDDDVNIETGDSDHVYAYFGMRRGGNNYYALDLTERSNPILKWTISGGSSGFQDMGQTWSRPTLSQVNWNCDSSGENCTTKNVLFFSGGYNIEHDTATAPTDITSTKGAAIYMIDADTGTLLWSAGNNSTSSDSHDLNLPMIHSMPGNLTVADMSGDGATDIIFGVDILGHVWRIDINGESQSVSDFATGGEIANLTDNSEFRRFYTGPTVSLSQKRGRTPFFILTMGTGYIAHPLDKTINDRVYAIFERNILSPLTDSSGNPIYTAINNTALLDMTSSSSGPANPDGNAPHGFYKDATADGEKFLRSAITQQGLTVYTSYLPDGVPASTSNSSCGSAQLGTSRIFAMDFVTGVSLYSGEYIDLDHPGISPEPVTLLIPTEDPDDHSIKKILCVGTECFSPDDAENPFGEVTTQVLYWRENIQ